MQIERRIERLHPLPERIIAGIIQIDAVGMAVDHGAGKAQLLDATLQLIGRCICVLHGEVGEAAIALGLLLNFPG